MAKVRHRAGLFFAYAESMITQTGDQPATRLVRGTE
jgi:hypothetical protein